MRAHIEHTHTHTQASLLQHQPCVLHVFHSIWEAWCVNSMRHSAEHKRHAQQALHCTHRVGEGGQSIALHVEAGQRGQGCHATGETNQAAARQVKGSQVLQPAKLQ